LLPMLGWGMFAFSGVVYVLSAMETALYLAVGLLLVERTIWRPDTTPQWASFGALGGMAFLTRPEGLLAYAVGAALSIVRAPGRTRSAALGGLAVASGVLLAITLPWEILLWHETGSLLPSSGRGRVLGFIGSVLPEVTAREYVQFTLADKIASVPTIVQTQLVRHPVVLVAAVLPCLMLVLTALVVALGRYSIEPHARALISFAGLYSSGNLGVYLLHQPLIFQRYLVLELPLAVLVGAVLIQKLASHLVRRCLMIGCSLVVVLSLVVGIPYYYKGARASGRLIALLSRFHPPTPCRLAAEPLGFARFFTPCYVIDMGGLINPDLWQHWAAGQSSIDYALARGATHVLETETGAAAWSGTWRRLATDDLGERVLFSTRCVDSEPQH
jgi:hypothetical protein